MDAIDPTHPDHAALIAARLAAIIESSDDAIVSKSLDGTILSWNAAAERIFGYSAAEIVGTPIFRLIPPELRGEEEDILARIARGEHVAHYETTRRRKDGAEIVISLTVSPIRNPGGTVVGASSIKRDITARRAAESALRQAAKMEAIGRLAGGLAHDFNNELHALSGFADFVARDPGLSPAAREDLLEIRKAADRMARLTRQLLAFARQQLLSPETLDLNGAVAEVRPMLQRLIGSNLEIELVLGPGPMWVRVDRAQLTQVLMNLVVNARDAMPRGGRLLVRTETLEASRGTVLDRLGEPVAAGTYVRLSVEDSGQGIAADEIHRIFEPFYTTKEVGHGTGLGLATVEGIVTQSGGRIQVESAVGVGTTIRILLPPVEPPIPAGSPLPPSPRGARAPRRVLVVDDEDLVRALAARVLREDGYEVVEARHGREAVERLEKAAGSVDLVVSDVVMPVMDGRALAESLARRYPAVPVIWMSGHPREAGFPDAGAQADQPFLSKPFPPDLLLEAVARVLESGADGRPGR